jgi:hypothetical protein
VAEGEAEDETGDGNGEEDVIDIGDGINGGGEGSIMEDDADANEGTEDEEDGAEDDEESTEDDEEAEEDPIVGNGFVEEVAEELAGSRTRRGHHYDRGGGTCDSELCSLHLRERDPLRERHSHRGFQARLDTIRPHVAQLTNHLSSCSLQRLGLLRPPIHR